MTFKEELESLINKYSKESDNNTPDFILTKYIMACLDAYTEAVKSRDQWYDYDPWSALRNKYSPSDDRPSPEPTEGK